MSKPIIMESDIAIHELMLILYLSLIGMKLLLSANNLFIVYLGVESQSPCFM